MSHQHYTAYSAIELYISLIFRKLYDVIFPRNSSSCYACLSLTHKRSPAVTSTVNVES